MTNNLIKLLAFGEHTGISKGIRERIDNVRQLRQVSLNRFALYSSSQTERFTDQAWRLLGRYIANNTHLEDMSLSNCNLITDQKMTLLFSDLSSSKSLTQLRLSGNEFGIDGVRSMIPFLQNSPNLFEITFDRNNNINTECFELVVQTLHGRPLEGRTLEFKLSFRNCGITNISALDTYTLPNITQLNLSGNNIGREGCITISNLLSNFEYLDLSDTGMGDEEAELLATSLKNNTKLRTFCLENPQRDNPPSPQTRNNITERGYKAFLKLTFDVSSIENMYKSNHTLRALYLPECSFRQECKHKSNKSWYSKHGDSIIIDSLFGINSDPGAAGRAKVIKYQLNSENRKRLCELEDIEYIPGSNFADIEPLLLPRILSLIGREHGQSEFYTALIHTAPDLMSCVDTSGMRKDLIAQNSIQMVELTRQLAALSAKNDELSGILALRESCDSRHLTIEGSREMAESGKKRQRSLELRSKDVNKEGHD